MAGEVERTIVEVASRRHGACDRAELLAAGLSGSAIDRRLRSGFLRPIAAGAYVLSGVGDHVAVAAAALLAAPSAAISHRSAAGQHRFPLPPDDHVHLVVPHGTTRLSHPTLAVHETRHLPASDVLVRDGLRVTTPARTIVDLAGSLRPARLSNLVERQLIAGHPTAAELMACHQATARRGRAGSGRLRQVLTQLLDGEPFPGSELEAIMVRLLAALGADGVRRQYRPPWFDGVRGVVDFARPASRLIIEVDGRAWHGTNQAFSDDRRRDRIALAHGWRVLRFGWSELVHRPDEVSDELRAHLGPEAVQEAGA